MDYFETLKKIGLNEKEINIYSVLLEQGEQKIADLLQKTKLKRGDLYYALDNLVAKSLIEKEDKEKKLHFRLNHPNRLQELVEEKEREVKNLGSEIQAILPVVISNYNLVSNQPGVKMVEGPQGVKLAMDDSLNSQTEILTILTPDEVDKYIDQANKNYIKRRYNAGIKKKILVADNHHNRKHYQGKTNELTEIRYIKGVLVTSGAVLQIYNNKVNYIIIKPSGAIGLIIDNASIANMQRSLFMLLWNSATE